MSARSARSRRPRVALISHRVSLPWIFDAADRVGCDLVLLPRAGEQLKGKTLPPSVVDVLDVDVLADPDAGLAELERYHGEHRLDGVITLFDPSVPFTATAAARLGLPGLPPEVALGTTNKRNVRRRLAAAGANTPGFVSVAAPHDPEGMADLIERDGLRFPVVIKPTAGYSSLGVVRVDEASQLPAELARVAELSRAGLPVAAGAQGLVVEEYLDGPEYAVESFVWRGRTHGLTIGYKGQPAGPYFEEGVYRAPAELAPELRDRILEQVALANDALGIDAGPVHTELRVRPDGAPVIFDIGARVGGSGVSHFIVAESTGVDFAGNALRVALGEPPLGLPEAPVVRGYAGNFIVPCGGAGVIDRIDGLAELGALPQVRHVVQMLFPGDVVRPYPEFSGYPAFVLSAHHTAEDLLALHRRLASEVRVRYQ